jgi:DNA modification methylase
VTRGPIDTRHPLDVDVDEFVWRGKFDAAGNRRGVDPPTVGARLRVVEAHGAQRDDEADLLVAGDNLDALHLLAGELRGRVRVAYLDPPFEVGTTFSMRTQLGTAQGADARRRDSVEVPAYDDRWGPGRDGWSRMVWQRLVLVRELLAEDGTIYVHCDWRTSHRMRGLLDDVFGAGAFGNEVAWCYASPGRSASRFKPCHDTIFRYVAGRDPVWTRPQQPLAPATLAVTSLRFGGQETTWTRTRDTRDMADWWTIPFPTGSGDRTGYPTQKPVELLERIIEASSNPGDIVLDAFAGSGTTAIAARRSGRRFVAIDASPVAIRVAAARLDARLQGDAGWRLVEAGVDDAAATTTRERLEARAAWRGDDLVVELRGASLDVGRLTAGMSPADATQVRDRLGREPLELVERWLVAAEGDTVLAACARTRRDRSLARELVVPAGQLPAGAETIAVHALDLRGARLVTCVSIPGRRDHAGAVLAAAVSPRRR